MHNLTKIKLFRILLHISYPFALVFLYPIVLFKRKHRSGLFFFFDRYVIGGAQRVHLDILSVLAKQQKKVFFTRYSPNNKLKKEFYAQENTECKDIHIWCDYLLFRLFTVHYYAFYLNRHKEAIVFSSNSTFFYDMLPFLSSSVYTAELLHNFTLGKSGMEFFGLANYKHISKRITVDEATRQNILKQYAENNIPTTYNDKTLLIEPGINVPDQHIAKSNTPPLKVLYAGRGGKQKRIHLLNKVAESLIKQNADVEFHFAGTMADELSDYTKANSVMHGEISSPEKMYELYQNCHVIILTSAYEGFPMFIKEGMANSCIPVVTALDGNKTHLTHNQNALLVDHFEDEDYVVNQSIQLLEQLVATPEMREELSNAAYTYAKAHFDKTIFNKKYTRFFEER